MEAPQVVTGTETEPQCRVTARPGGADSTMPGIIAATVYMRVGEKALVMATQEVSKTCFNAARFVSSTMCTPLSLHM